MASTYRPASKAMVLCTMGTELVRLGSTAGMGSTMWSSMGMGSTMGMESSMGVGSTNGYGVHHCYGVHHGYRVHHGYGGKSGFLDRRRKAAAGKKKGRRDTAHVSLSFRSALRSFIKI